MDTSKVIPLDLEHWAHGCADCHYGYVCAPDIHASALLPLYLQRAVQAANGDIEFCTCRAGVAARAGLGRIWKAELKQRPDIDAIQANVKHATPTPSMRYVHDSELLNQIEARIATGQARTYTHAEVWGPGVAPEGGAPS